MSQDFLLREAENPGFIPGAYGLRQATRDPMGLYNAPMARARFPDLLQTAWKDERLVCVGLDPNPAKIPAHLGQGPSATFEFCKSIVDATSDGVCAFKPQIAWFSAAGHEQVLVALIEYVHKTYPDIPVILDAKRGDIGETNKAYAREAFERYKADAVTVSPYLGLETLQPFIDHTDKGIFVLCRTSNPQAEWMQTHPEDDPAYLRVAREVVKANLHGNLMLVAGATHVDELAQIRNAVGNMPLLVPGIGAQGGNLEEVVRVGAYEGGGLVINVSRSVAYAGAGKDFASAATRALERLNQEIRGLL